MSKRFVMISFIRTLKLPICISLFPLALMSALISSLIFSACTSSSACCLSISFNFLIRFSIVSFRGNYHLVNYNPLSISPTIPLLMVAWSRVYGLKFMGLSAFPVVCFSFTVITLCLNMYMFLNSNTARICTCIFVQYVHVHILVIMLYYQCKVEKKLAKKRAPIGRK